MAELVNKFPYVNDVLLKTFFQVLNEDVFVGEVLEQHRVWDAGLFTLVQFPLHFLQNLLLKSPTHHKFKKRTSNLSSC